jgi:hypothetical protein
MPRTVMFDRISQFAALACAVATVMIGVSTVLGHRLPGAETITLVLMGTCLILGASRIRGIADPNHPGVGNSSIFCLLSGLFAIAVTVSLIYTSASTFG